MARRAADEAKIEHRLARFRRRVAINKVAWTYANKGVPRDKREAAYALCRDVVKRYVEERDPTTEEVLGLDVAVLLRKAVS